MTLPYRENTLAVIITYNPDIDLRMRVESILQIVQTLLIIDNNSQENKHVTRELAALPGVILVDNAENVGVATGLNQALNYGWSHPQYKWLLTFDQDTTVYPNMLKQYESILSQCDQPEKVAVLGSNYYCRSISDTRYHFATDASNSKNWTEIHTVITSGSLMSIPLSKVVGHFRDDFFIDHVDDEYCLRSRQNGFKVLINKTALMEHNIGAESLHQFMWRKTGTSNHSALRRYYMMRNHLYLVQAYLFVEPKWVLRTVYSRMKMMILMLMFEENRWIKLKHCLVGIQHGIQKILGKSNIQIKQRSKT